LRAGAVVEHARLPGGGSVEVWVGIPDDSYIPRNEQTNVDLQLREGDNVLATVTTVLDAEQTGEAIELAREVVAAIEAGEIPLTASALEPYADRLR
jgi:porphobilinogen deaminase